MQVSYNVKDGDRIDCTISELQPLSAEPEDIPLDIVYEDDHVLVVNKPAHMVFDNSPSLDCSFSLRGTNATQFYLINDVMLK